MQSGDAFDVTAERVQTDYTQEPLPPLRRGLPTRQRVTASYRVTITNAKTDAVTVDVRESHFGTWRVTDEQRAAPRSCRPPRAGSASPCRPGGRRC